MASFFSCCSVTSGRLALSAVNCSAVACRCDGTLSCNSILMTNYANELILLLSKLKIVIVKNLFLYFQLVNCLTCFSTHYTQAIYIYNFLLCFSIIYKNVCMFTVKQFYVVLVFIQILSSTRFFVPVFISCLVIIFLPLRWVLLFFHINQWFTIFYAIYILTAYICIPEIV